MNILYELEKSIVYDVWENLNYIKYFFRKSSLRKLQKQFAQTR